VAKKKVITEIVSVPVGKLTHHRVNQYTYQDAQDDEFAASVERDGILTPLKVSRRKGQHIIISGHRRQKAAIDAGLTHVPVEYVTGLYEDEVLRMLVACNIQRTRTNEQKAREASVMTEAEDKRRHRLKIKAKAAGEDAPVYDKTSQQAAADNLGISKRTASTAVTVDKQIQAAEASGDHVEAERLRTALNKSFSAGAKAGAETDAAEDKEPAAKPKPKPPAPFDVDLPAVAAIVAESRAFIDQAVERIDAAEEKNGGISSYSRKLRTVLTKSYVPADEWLDGLDQ
jgi:ParB-like chromosome segregation protein Spo0J